MSPKERIPLARPFVQPEAAAAVAAVLRSGQLVRGPYVAALEAALCARVGVPHALAVGSGTAALELALRAAGIGAGDEVVLPDFTFPALSNAIEHVGATPVTVDVSLDTFNATAAQLLAAVGPMTRCVMPVHQFGLPGELAPLLAAARDGGFVVIEDAACALGGVRDGVACGAMGLAGGFSFHPRKVVTTGEGGAVTTADEGFFRRAVLLSNHGMDPGRGFERFVSAGFNHRMGELNGAAAAGQMERLDAAIGARRAAAARYVAGLAGVPGVVVPAGHRDPAHTFQSFVVLVGPGVDRAAVLRGLAARGVEATIGSYAIHRQPHYRTRFPELAARARPGSAAAFERSVALPMFAGLRDDEVDRVVEALSESVREGGAGQ